ncbi:MAG: helix-turn-helix transcriptional regulator [Clostridia bacterium]|nr:helix-turn-helix transcriptional regulator [Clostridia bacterium]
MRALRGTMKDLYNVKPIEDFMTQNKLTKTEFCKRCGLDLGTLDRVLLGHVNMRVQALIKLSQYMQVSIAELFKKCE